MSGVVCPQSAQVPPPDLVGLHLKSESSFLY